MFSFVVLGLKMGGNLAIYLVKRKELVEVKDTAE